MTGTDQLLPDRLNGMDTAPGITDEELRESVARAIWHKTYIHDTLLPWCEIKPGTMHHRRCIEAADHALTAMRAVASRTRQATPAPDAMAAAVEIMKKITTPALDHFNSDGLDLGGWPDDTELAIGRADEGEEDFTLGDLRRAKDFIARHTGEK